MCCARRSSTHWCSPVQDNRLDQAPIGVFKKIRDENFKINFLHEKKTFFDDFFLNLKYKLSAFQRTQARLAAAHMSHSLCRWTPDLLEKL